MQNQSPKTNKKSRKLTVDDLRKAKIVYLAASGQKISKIAKEQGLTRQWISEVINRPENQSIFQKILDDTQAEVERRLPNLITKAFDLVERELDSRSGYGQAARLATATRLIELFLKHQPGCPNCSHHLKFIMEDEK